MNCQWLNSKLESYFCDGLSEEDRQVFQKHMASCEDCRQRVESLKEIDPLVREVLQRRLAIARMAAQSNPRPRLFKLGMGAAGLAAAVVLLLVVGLRFAEDTPIPPPPVAIQPPPVQQLPPEVKKDPSPESNPSLTKPKDGTPAKPAPQPQLDSPLPDGPDFAITDAAGYTATLETYRGRVLLFAVVSADEKAAIANLQQLYDAFGSNPGIRVFAVARHREDQFNGVSFPVFFNNGSRLLGVQDGKFLLADASGKSKLEGSLSDSASVARIKSQLGQLGIR
jgi:Putative zinc-finger